MNFDNNNRSIVLWAAIGLAAFVLLPWYALPEGLLGMRSWAELLGGHDSSTALAQVLLHRRPWLVLGALPLLVGVGAAAMAPTRAQGKVLMCSGALGAV